MGLEQSCSCLNKVNEKEIVLQQCKPPPSLGIYCAESDQIVPFSEIVTSEYSYPSLDINENERHQGGNQMSLLRITSLNQISAQNISPLFYQQQSLPTNNGCQTSFQKKFRRNSCMQWSNSSKQQKVIINPELQQKRTKNLRKNSCLDYSSDIFNQSFIEFHQNTNLVLPFFDSLNIKQRNQLRKNKKY